MISHTLLFIYSNILQGKNTVFQNYHAFVILILVVTLVYLNKVLRVRRAGSYPILFEYLALRPLEHQFKRVIARYFIYYQKLSPSKKSKFEKRMQRFIDEKEFIGREMDQVSVEMKALIAASATQLTFGLSNVYLAHFKRILIYPDTYYSTINQQYHKGEVNPEGQLIVLSWKSFLDGYIDPNDSYNLGLHEMAHALLLENRIKNKENNFFSKRALKNFFKLAEVEIHEIKAKGNHPLFRNYGGENKHEFFAVTVETFFENPQKFRSLKPELYKALVKLLHQDPCKLYC